MRFDIYRDHTRQVAKIDLWTDRAHWTGKEPTQQLRRLLHGGTEMPSWTQRRQSLLDQLREFERALLAEVEHHAIRGEPQVPDLGGALDVLAGLDYVDVATTKKHIVDAEEDFRARRWKPAAAVFRSAIERVLQDGHHELGVRNPPVTATNLRDRSEELGRTSFISKEAARFAYGTYALLSDIGNHPGDVPDELGECAWHAGKAAIVHPITRRPPG